MGKLYLQPLLRSHVNLHEDLVFPLDAIESREARPTVYIADPLPKT